MKKPLNTCGEFSIADFGEFLTAIYIIIPDIEIKRNDNSQIRDKIMSIDPEKRKELKINKSTLWYQQKKIKEGKTIKVYNKTKVMIE